MSSSNETTDDWPQLDFFFDLQSLQFFGTLSENKSESDRGGMVIVENRSLNESSASCSAILALCRPIVAMAAVSQTKAEANIRTDFRDAGN